MKINLINLFKISSVSSVLNDDTKQFGKQYLTDGNAETCWNSDQGPYQWIYCSFNNHFTLKQFKIQFQGGFSSKKIQIIFLDNDKNIIDEDIYYPEDNNLLQTFTISKNINAKLIRFLLCDCSDTFGRIILYKFELFGNSVQI